MLCTVGCHYHQHRRHCHLSSLVVSVMRATKNPYKYFFPFHFEFQSVHFRCSIANVILISSAYFTCHFIIFSDICSIYAHILRFTMYNFYAHNICAKKPWWARTPVAGSAIFYIWLLTRQREMNAKCFLLQKKKNSADCVNNHVISLPLVVLIIHRHRYGREILFDFMYT